MAPDTAATTQLFVRHRIAAAWLIPTLAIALMALLAGQASALRVVDWNILNYPGLNPTGREPHYRTVLAPLAPDVIVVQEMQSQAGVDEFLSQVLNVIEPGQWAAAPFINGNDTDNAMFYRTSAVQFLGQWAFYVAPDNLRLVTCYRLKPVGYASAAAEFRLYSLHLKASSGSSNQARRLAEATGLRDSMNAVPPGTHAAALGDFNIYSGAEPAFAKLLELQADNDGRLYDPLNAPPVTWNTASLASIHTQSPCSTCPSGFSTGGLDDRFDMFLPTYNWQDGEGIDLVPGSYVPIGNDGHHYNLNITDLPTIPEGAVYANALYNASDHLPIRIDLQVPAEISAPLALDLGTVIEGAPASATLSFTNPAVPPADELTYSFTTDPSFVAPAGLFALDPQAPPEMATISAAPGAFGTLIGNVTILSDAPDDPAHAVHVTATVLHHAAASFDSVGTVLESVLDLGGHVAGGFEPMGVRVHNRDYDITRARLALQSAVITGAGGRFSIVGGFSPSLVAGLGRTFEILFDDTGAAADSLYEATLTFGSADEALPGATSQPDLTVALRAYLESGKAGVDPGAAPLAFRLHPPAPNPLVHATSFAFDLPAPSAVRLEVFDLSGRRVALLADRAFSAGRHTQTWDGRDGNGSNVNPGIYLVRLAAGGFAPQIARIAVVR